MSRYARPRSLSYSFGPGPITPAVKWIIWINVGAFVATVIRHDLLYVLGVIPQAVVERVNREIGRTLRAPEVAERMQADGVTPSASTPEELRARIQREIPMWKGVVARARIKLE